MAILEAPQTLTPANDTLIALHGGEPALPQFVVFGAPALGEEEIAEVVHTLRSGWIGTGSKTKAFESAFAAYVGAKHAIAVNSCTAALHLSLLGSGIGPGDEVITNTIIFSATAMVALFAVAQQRIA